MKFTGKTAIVTGGSRDIGRAISVKLASEGANVVVNYFSNEADADATLAAIEATGSGKAIKVRADVTKSEDVAKLVAAATEAFGDGIDILVNNAGGLVARKPLAEMDEEFFNHVIQLNLTSTFLATKAAAEHMGEGGAIVNLASLVGRDGGGGAAAYATSKGAVMTFTRAMAKELGPRGIRVNALCPGMIATAFHDKFTPDAARENVANSTPLRRQGRAEETADAVAYLASDEASFINGANVDINGGLAFS